MPLMEVITVDITTQQPPLAELLKLLDDGSEVILAAAGRQVARLSPATATPSKRIAGLHEGQGWVSDDFDDPLSDEFWGGRV